MPGPERLFPLLEGTPFVYIQTHNFPDHDAVASAYGLQVLLKHFNISSRLVYDGEISRSSLSRMIHSLGIDIRHISGYSMEERQKIIIVDGCKGNNNVTELTGDEIAVIDHHEVSAPQDVPYSDIRPEYGACATIVYSYFRDLGVVVPRDAATALMLGITMDTSHFIRGADREDLDAYAELYASADVALVNTIARNDVSYPDLRFYEYAFENLEISGRFGFVYFHRGCGKNLLGIISDFILALDEVDFVVLCAANDGVVNFSVRSEKTEWDASVIMRQVLEGIGFGGGHSDMAGGVIKDASLFDRERIHTAFKERLTA